LYSPDVVELDPAEIHRKAGGCIVPFVHIVVALDSYKGNAHQPLMTFLTHAQNGMAMDMLTVWS
jgi:hypothetical protein